MPDEKTKERLNEIRERLYDSLVSHNLSSGLTLELSRELDLVILEYFSDSEKSCNDNKTS